MRRQIDFGFSRLYIIYVVQCVLYCCPLPFKLNKQLKVSVVSEVYLW